MLQLPPASRPLEPLPVEPPQAHLPPRNTPGLRLTIYMQIREWEGVWLPPAIEGEGTDPPEQSQGAVCGAA